MYGEEDISRVTVLQPPDNVDSWGRNRTVNYEVDGSNARIRFREFFRNFKLDNVFLYRDALVRNWSRNLYFVEVDLAHLNEFDEALFNSLQTRPTEIMHFFEVGAKEALKLSLTMQNEDLISQPNVPDFQITLKSNQSTQSIRNLTAEHINSLIKVPGIVITCSKTRSKATSISIRCTKCQTVKTLPNKNAIGAVQIPSKCEAGTVDDCGPYPFVIMADKCDYIDQQNLKLQESPEVVPTGEMPRNVMLSLDRYLVDRVAPGTRISVIGVASLFTSGNTSRAKTNAKVKTLYLRVLGLEVDTAGGGRTSTSFTPQEEDQMQKLARDPEIYEKIARSIAPSISGEYTQDIKKALACLLMGGSRKNLGDGVRLRGDINVLLMGDPSTAKSQFLKFIEKVAPIGVYTSGKGSSAAGLTASVIKDAKGEFYLEGGAMVLADGGVICIDEFDKMRENDRVAIHEAMEQQTISIAKAGITTVLNCRTSVLAAANPLYGRYDDMKAVGENIDLMTTILSRFDCIFIVRDVRDQERDRNIARHVMSIHVNSSLAENIPQAQGEIDALTLKKFVSYCREKCAPRLNEEAEALLSGQYVHIRNRIRNSMMDSNEAQVVPITIRQLEALIRMSEALAKMRLSAEATTADVQEALRLFKVSTLAASEANPMLAGGGGVGGVPAEDIAKAEQFLRRSMGLRMSVSLKALLETAQSQGHNPDAVRRGVMAMVMRQEMQEINQGKVLRRVR